MWLGQKKRHLFHIAARISLNPPRISLFFLDSEHAGHSPEHFASCWKQIGPLLRKLWPKECTIILFLRSKSSSSPLPVYKKFQKSSPTIRLLWHAPQYCKSCWIHVHFEFALFLVEFKIYNGVTHKEQNIP